MYKHILLPVDLNDDTSWDKSLPVAIEQAKAFGAVLHVMTVAPSVGMPFVGQFFPDNYEQQVEDQMMQALHTFVKEHVPKGIQVQHVISQGSVYREILDAAEKIPVDLIIMEAHHPALEDFLLGPNTFRVVHNAKCSVLVVR